jgi:hypothetical protein
MAFYSGRTYCLIILTILLLLSSTSLTYNVVVSVRPASFTRIYSNRVNPLTRYELGGGAVPLPVPSNDYGGPLKKSEPSQSNVTDFAHVEVVGPGIEAKLVELEPRRVSEPSGNATRALYSYTPRNAYSGIFFSLLYVVLHSALFAAIYKRNVVDCCAALAA